MKMIQAGSCNIDNEPSYVKLVLLVDAKTNKITGTEYARDQNNQYTKADHITWTGEVLNDESFRLQEKYSFTCSEVKRTETLHFIGVKDENRIKLTDRFAMCPDMNCIFDIEYDLKIVNNWSRATPTFPYLDLQLIAHPQPYDSNDQAFYKLEKYTSTRQAVIPVLLDQYGLLVSRKSAL